MGFHNRQWLIGTLLTLMAIGTPVAGDRGPHGDSTADGVRTIVITAKDMRFNVTNPTITFAPGELIRIVFRNEDPGMKHDLMIPDLGLGTRVLEAGEETVLRFRAPKSGLFLYLCSLHPVSMRGAFRVSN